MAWPPRTADQTHTPPPFIGGRDLLRPLSIPAAVAASLFLAAAAWGQTAPTAAPQYAGSEACAACHDDLAKSFRRNPHQRLETRAEWKGRACEACHGPGAKHAESATAADIFNPAKLRPADSEQACLKCHRNQPAQHGRIQGGHGRNQVACTSCHAVHKTPQELTLRNAAAANLRCASCHKAEWSEFLRPYAHRLTQGAMSCADCHDPHGNERTRSVRSVAANEPGCFRCHGDKRGPFPFEHPPMRLEGCQGCHEPHGSTNPRMLVRAEVRFVCLECHSNIGSQPALGGIPPGLHDLRSARYRNCTICHNKIHGSFVDRRLMR